MGSTAWSGHSHSRNNAFELKFITTYICQICWCDDLGLDPEEYINEAIKAQKKFKNNFLKNMYKKIKIEIAVGIILAVAIIIGALIWMNNKQNFYKAIQRPESETTIKMEQNTQFEQPQYGNISGYFSGEILEQITYPLIFDTIRIDNSERIIRFGPQKVGDFSIFMSASELSKEYVDEIKSDRIERGYILEKNKLTRNGYVVEMLSSDIKANPNPKVTSCSLAYNYFIPRLNSNRSLNLWFQASQLNWDPAKTNVNCKIFDDQNYNYLKSIADNIINQIQPIN